MTMILRYRYFVLIILLFAHSAMAADVPTNVTLTATETTIKVDWTGDSDADNYFVYWGATSSNLNNRATVDDSATEYTITGLESATTYYVAVSSNENSEESDLSDVKSVTTAEDTGIPETPAGFSVAGIDTITESSVALTWEQNTETDLDHYNIYYGQTSGVYDGVLEAAKTNSESFTVSGLQNATRYYFSITASDTSDNESEYAEELIVDTFEDNLSPYKPAGISGRLSDANSIKIDIVNGNTRMADFKGSILYFGSTSGNLDNRVDLNNSFTYTVTNLQVGTILYFTAAAYDYSGNESARTSEISVAVEETFRFLNQPEDFDGGCFIDASKGADSYNIRWILFLSGIGLLMINYRLFKRLFALAVFVFLLTGVLFDTAHAETMETPGNNIFGVCVGYYIPLESDFDKFYGEDVFPVYGFYERFFSRYFSVDASSGFVKEKGYLLTKSGETTDIKTKLTLVPVAVSMNFNLQIMPYVVGYIGAGPDYWYCQEETDDTISHPEIEEWVGGFHGKIGFRLYNTDENYTGTGALIETSYSQIDRFGDNHTDIGGWAFKFGLFYHF